MKQLNPFYGHDVPVEGRQIERFNQTVDFIGEPVCPILSIGEKSLFDTQLSVHFDREIDFTVGDLDSFYWEARRNTYNTVFCFEVLEHLLNPLLFLSTLKYLLDDDSRVYVSIPNHLLKYHWGTGHYHEIDEMRFRYLCDRAGYEIVRMKVRRYYPLFPNGIRPLIKYVIGWSWFVSRTDRYYYELKIKKHVRI